MIYYLLSFCFNLDGVYYEIEQNTKIKEIEQDKILEIEII